MTAFPSTTTAACTPNGICSWNYTIRGAGFEAATLNFNWFGEQGSILYRGLRHEVIKNGFMSGQWLLLRSGRSLATAQKPNPFFRAFHITADQLSLELKASALLGRSFDLLSDGNVVGRIQPVHAFTRRATIACSTAVPFLVQVFAFALVVVIWRRMARRNNSSVTHSVPAAP